MVSTLVLIIVELLLFPLFILSIFYLEDGVVFTYEMGEVCKAYKNCLFPTI